MAKVYRFNTAYADKGLILIDFIRKYDHDSIIEKKDMEISMLRAQRNYEISEYAKLKSMPQGLRYVQLTINHYDGSIKSALNSIKKEST